MDTIDTQTPRIILSLQRRKFSSNNEEMGRRLEKFCGKFYNFSSLHLV